MMGYERFLLIDMDSVETGNIGRQILFTQGDIGLSKVEVVKKRIENRFRKATCHCIAKPFETIPHDILSNVDLFIGCVDNIETRHAINTFIMKSSKIYIDGGSTGLGGQVQLIVPFVSVYFHSKLENSLLSLFILFICFRILLYSFVYDNQ